MKVIRIILFLSLVMPAFSAYADDLAMARENFEAGNKHYKEGSYEAALKSFLLADSMASGFDVNFNIGNTYYKLGDIPQAIRYYERARKFHPGNEDVRHNLDIANDQIVDRIDSIPESKLNVWWKEFKYGIGSNGWAWITILLAALLAALILSFILFSGKNNKRALFLGALFTMVLLIASYSIGQDAKTYLTEVHSAIITTDKVDVRSEPNKNSTQVFVLHAGTKVKLIDSEGEWSEVEIASGNRGWMRKVDLAEI